MRRILDEILFSAVRRERVAVHRFLAPLRYDNACLALSDEYVLPIVVFVAVVTAG